MAKKSSIRQQILIPVVAILISLTLLIIGAVLYIFSSFYEADVNERTLTTSQYVAETVSKFLDGAYNVTEELAQNPVISANSDNAEMHEILLSTTVRNPYMELLYTVNLAGMQTARSSGTPGDRKNRWWFIKMMETKKPFISQSYYSVGTGRPCASIYIPIKHGGSMSMTSLLGADLDLSFLQKLIETYLSKNTDRYSFIIDSDGVVVAHPQTSFIEELYNYKGMTRTIADTGPNGEAIKDSLGNIKTHEEKIEVDSEFEACLERLFSGKSGTGRSVIEGKKSFVSYAPVELKGESGIWGVITVESQESAFAVMNGIIRILIAIGVVTMILAIIIVIILARSITSPIARIIPVIEALAHGDFTKRIAPSKTKNEINDIITAFNTVTAQIEDSREREHALGDKLFLETQNLAVATKETAATSQDSNAAVKEIVATMEDSNSLSENISSKIRDVSMIAEKNSKEVQAGVAAIEKNVNQLRAIFDANQQNIDGMKVLSERINSIWDIVTLINSIADQAKIIAFNTELEVASAGEAGEPFRIVSSEIRRLSDGIIDGTKEIKEKITEIQKSSDNLILASENSTEKINDGYENAKELGERFESIRDSSEITSASAQEITEIIQQQATGSEQILIALKQIAGGVENFSAATENISRSAENLRSISEELNKQMTTDEEDDSSN